MKKILYVSLLSIITLTTNAATTPWWQQPTICRLDPTNCYPAMGAGFDSGMWDATANCWGLKLVCPHAMKTQHNDPVPVGRGDIASGRNINADFDVSLLNGDCFGVRKTTANGTKASVNGTYVNVWCNGILDNPDEQVASGEITFGTQPSCARLAADGYVAVVNNRCYGKHFNDSEYFIECTGSDILPSRLIVLNGADYNTGGANVPADESAADAIFDQMYQTSQIQYKKYFKDE